MAERLCETVAATSFALPEGGCLSITVSAGVVGYSSGELVPGPLAFVGAADQALMRAKKNGRNRVEQEALLGSSADLIFGAEHERPLGRLWTPP